MQNYNYNLSGGAEGYNALRSTVLITINPPSTKYGPTLPKDLLGHCSVLVGDTIFVIGGRTKGYYVKKTLMIDTKTGKITNGPDMATERGYVQCTSYVNKMGENIILALGGYGGRGGDAEYSTEILKVNGGKLSWTKGLQSQIKITSFISFFNIGPDLPEECENGSLVSSPNGEWIVLLGCVNQKPNKIYKLEGNSWTLYPKELKYLKTKGLAFPVSDHLVNCVDN